MCGKFMSGSFSNQYREKLARMRTLKTPHLIMEEGLDGLEDGLEWLTKG